ncbi:hypothetical protein RUMCAL_02328 [Ruminococcus callidus ATCC 27760]|uniref:Uncharacterized protein n=1 Tax=Ruminococcus callidus ATCC 27760 TaxID=411473 RepID=U2KL53_9FIRM|nr:hypothetical protein RUMCAL_02328 [Ruminococcus callidus ATCC 27760]
MYNNHCTCVMLYMHKYRIIICIYTFFIFILTLWYILWYNLNRIIF